MARMEANKLLFDSVVHLGNRGLSARTISAQTGFSVSQVQYRLRAAGCKLKHYRNGETDQAREIILMTPCVKLKLRAQTGQPTPVQRYV